MISHKTLHHCILVLATTFGVASGSSADVYDRVTVRGAELIPEEDIRKTCGELQGIYIDEAEMRAVEECLMSTAVFERVSISGEGKELVIDVTEIEQRPGRIDAGISWVNDRSLTGTLSYEQFNLIPDSFTAIHGDFSRDVESFDMNFYRPEAFGPKLHFGIDLTGENADYRDLSFSVRNRQAEAYLAWTPRQHLRIEYGLGYRDHRLYDVNASASRLLLRDRGQQDAPFLRFGLTYRDAEADRQGWFVRVEQFLWNISTASPVSESRVELGSTLKASGQTDLMLRLGAGLVAGLSGNDTTALDRLFPGGDSFRGFAPRGIGPADQGDMLGGNRYLIASAELQRDLGKIAGQHLRGGAFIDIGSVWDLDDDLDGRIDDSSHIRSSIGLTLSMTIGETPVSVYAATPLSRQPQDKRQNFGLMVSANF